MTRPAVLVVGATGVFGSRLAEALARDGSCRVILAGRRPAPLDEAAGHLRAAWPQAAIETAVLDRETATAKDLLATGARVVVDAAGPFQGQTPRLARMAIGAGLHYLDLADARDFVAAFGALDRAARDAGVVALTGLSSTPALSNAALDALTRGWASIAQVDVAIAPGNRAPRGRAVVEAILSYAGRPVLVLRDGAWRTHAGWGLLRAERIPGLGRRWLSLCETPDLDVIPARYPQVTSAVFRAGLELAPMHLGLWLLSLPVRAGFVRSLRPLAPALMRVAGWLRPFGGDRGGMLVTARGRDAEGRAVTATWALEAVDGTGPEVPALPAAAVAKALAAGAPIPPGARVAVDVLPLSAYEREFAGRSIVTRRRTLADGPMPGPGLLRGALGRDFDDLPDLMREVHGGEQPSRLLGRGTIEGATTGLGRLLARLVGLPTAAADVPADVSLVPQAGSERWTRRFPSGAFGSVLSPSPRPGHVRERIGLLAVELAAWRRDTGFELIAEAARLGPLPLPRWATPQARGRAWLDGEGRYAFAMEVSVPLLGRLIGYHGWLRPVCGQDPADHDSPGGLPP